MSHSVAEIKRLDLGNLNHIYERELKGVCGALPVGICLVVPCHLGARCGLEELVDIGSRSCPLRPTSLRWLPQNSWVQAMSMIRCRLSPRLASL